MPGATFDDILYRRYLKIVEPINKNLVFGSIAAAVLSVLLVVMLIVACRNRRLLYGRDGNVNEMTMRREATKETF